MSRKHRKHKNHPKYLSFEKATVKPVHGNLVTLPAKKCHEPHFVKVGEYKVYICGSWDVSESALETIRGLDLFIGLDSSWKGFYAFPSANRYVNYFQGILISKLENLYVYHVPDGNIDAYLPIAAIQALRRGLSIGFGCMGGHGRTGWLLGRLIKEIEGLTGDDLKSAVRTRLCDEAIEGFRQHEDLGIKFIPKYVDTGTPYTSPGYWEGGHFMYGNVGEWVKNNKKDLTSDGATASPGGGIKTEIDTCFKCNGKGFNDGYKCDECDGLGKV